jgi:hypothetical protein
MESRFVRRVRLRLLDRIQDGFESRRVVHGQFGENLAVQVDIGGMNFTHELGVRHSVETGCSVNTLNPQGTEATLFVFTVPVSILETFFNRVFGNGPYIFTGTEITLGQLEYFFPLGLRSDVID